MLKRSVSAFTLSELLISLAILGVIATFTIPKVLQSQQDDRFNAVGKEGMASLAAAYEAYKRDHTPTAATEPGDLTPYLNYVRIDTGTLIDHMNTAASIHCGSRFCLQLHNGAKIYFPPLSGFGGTASTNAMAFYLDPDGQYSNTTNGPGKSVQVWLYYGGRITSRSGISPVTFYQGGGAIPPNPSYDPDWLDWN